MNPTTQEAQEAEVQVSGGTVIQLISLQSYHSVDVSSYPTEVTVMKAL